MSANARGARAGETELSAARRQFIQQALKNPGGAQTAYQSSMVSAQKQAGQQAFRGLIRGINSGREKVLDSMTARVSRFFSEAGLISKDLLANWHPLGKGAPSPGKAVGAGTKGAKSAGSSREKATETRSSGPALQYNGPKALDFRGGQ